MHLILEYTSDEEAEQALVHELFEVGGHGLENFLCEHTKLKDIHLHREKRALKNLLVSFDVDDKLKEGFTYMSSKQGKHILNRRNRLSDTLCLPEAGSPYRTLSAFDNFCDGASQSKICTPLISTIADQQLAPTAKIMRQASPNNK
ncbi:hypothetical protein DPMN_184134, partial [Dreissena polymorpha]